MKTTRSLTLFLALALLGLVFLALATPTARAAPGILRVKVNGATSDLSCGDTWDHACGLQYALTTVAVAGDELWVAAGTYRPTTSTDRTISFQLRNGIALYGGFAGSETLRSQRSFATNVTILSGAISSGFRSYHVVTAGSGVTNTAVLDGFTVTAGMANGYLFTDSSGGGLFNLGGSPTVSNVTFSGNYAGAGGGMFNYYGGNPTLSNVTFSNNSAGWGGGMYNAHISPTLASVTFFSNTAQGGGGMYNGMNSSPTLSNVTFTGNSADYGGGMDNEYSSPSLTNVTFMMNTANSGGGGMYNVFSSPTIRNAIFWGNTDPQISSADSTPSSTPSVYDSVVQGGCPAGSSTCTHIITADPRLGVLGNYGGSTQTIPLLAGSSAIDEGNPATCPPTDQRGKPRLGTCDIGAFEFQYVTHLPLIKR